MRVAVSPSAATLHVRGELDLASSATLRREFERVIAGSDRDLELDLSEVSFVDCTGMRAVLWCVGVARRQGRPLAVTGASRSMTRLSAALGHGVLGSA